MTWRLLYKSILSKDTQEGPNFRSRILCVTLRFFVIFAVIKGQKRSLEITTCPLESPIEVAKKNSNFALTMLINEEPLRNWIDNFYGYGSWQARFWFIGHEDTGGEVPEDVADKINYFANVKTQTEGTLCDVRELYKHVVARWESPNSNSFNNLFEYRFGKDAKQNGIWKNLILFIHGYQQTKPADLLGYQQQHFLSSSVPNEALISLYPLPGPNSHAWYYSWLELPQLGFLKSRKLYEDHVYQQRIQTILTNVGTYKPEVVLMYGMENINTLKESIQAFFHDVKFKMIKAEKQRIPQHHRADFHGTTILITTQLPALRHQRIETGFDWEELGRRVKSTGFQGTAVGEEKS